jgi:hypothetical protein
VVAKQDATLGPMPGYATVRRYMKDHGMFKNRAPLADLWVALAS